MNLVKIADVLLVSTAEITNACQVMKKTAIILKKFVL